MGAIVLAYIAVLMPAVDQFNDFAIPYLRHQGLSRVEVALITVPTVGIGAYFLWNLLILWFAAWAKGRIVPHWVVRVLLVEGKPNNTNSN